jgi:GYF domain 2
MRWYFLSDTQERIPTSEDQIPNLVSTGLLRAHSLVWPEGAADWKALGEIRPDLFTGGNHAFRPSPQAAGKALATHELTRTLAQRYGWLVASSGLFALLGLGCIRLAVAIGFQLRHAWTEAHSLEVSKGAGQALAWPIVWLCLSIYSALALAWLGRLLFQSANQLRQGLQLGESSLSGRGLESLGKFFTLLTITILIVGLGVAVIAQFSDNPFIKL